MDDIVEQLCANVCRHEVQLLAMSAAGAGTDASAVTRARCEIRVCEAWLALLGEERRLAQARAAAAGARTRPKLCA